MNSGHGGKRAGAGGKVSPAGKRTVRVEILLSASEAEAAREAAEREGFFYADRGAINPWVRALILRALKGKGASRG